MTLLSMGPGAACACGSTMPFAPASNVAAVQQERRRMPCMSDLLTLVLRLYGGLMPVA
jgi:hypothetical protein